ncbi:flagellar motor switch protein FliM [uncultured Gilliamella sp.]|uniref:flagellar motor switch protein FliM n=1 Tax=uncultured Gilliamella sp. TaxID=1193505 RepID=UPI0025E95158|nr:flagellar motor switch protein FliM [uncultured Gilliamella sp.]
MSDKKELKTDIHKSNKAGKMLDSESKTENNSYQDSASSLSIDKKAGVRPYDLSVKHNFIPERLTALEIINVRFARQFRIGLFNLLQRNIDVTVSPIVLQTFDEFTHISSWSHLNLIQLKPLLGSSLFSFSSEFVFLIVDTLFGGEGNITMKSKQREFTHTEQQIIKRVLDLALTIYQNIWASLYTIEVEYIRSEMQSKFTNITNSPDDIVLTSVFTVEVGKSKANFYICIPYLMVEPIKDLLIKPPSEQPFYQNDGVWMSSLTSGIKQSTVELVANFSQIDTTVAKLLALKVNDILLINKPTSLDVTVDGVPLLKGCYGKVNKQYAIQVEQVIDPVLEQLNEGILND